MTNYNYRGYAIVNDCKNSFDIYKNNQYLGYRRSLELAKEYIDEMLFPVKKFFVEMSDNLHLIYELKKDCYYVYYCINDEVVQVTITYEDFKTMFYKNYLCYLRYSDMKISIIE